MRSSTFRERSSAAPPSADGSARHDVAGPQVEAPDLRRRNVDVVRTGQIIVVGRRKPKAVGQGSRARPRREWTRPAPSAPARIPKISSLRIVDAPLDLKLRAMCANSYSDGSSLDSFKVHRRRHAARDRRGTAHQARAPLPATREGSFLAPSGADGSTAAGAVATCAWWRITPALARARAVARLARDGLRIELRAPRSPSFRVRIAATRLPEGRMLLPAARA